jgi:hypothetical protein
VTEVHGLEIDNEHEKTIQVLGRDVFELSSLNPYLLAVVTQNVGSLLYLTKTMKCHYKLAFRAPHAAALSRIQENLPQQADCFSLTVAIHHKNTMLLKFLWEELGFT